VVTGQLTFDSIIQVMQAAIDGLGLAYVPEDLARPHIEAGHLHVVLIEWCPLVQGYHLNYPSRRLPSPAFTRLLDALRYRGRSA